MKLDEKKSDRKSDLTGRESIDRSVPDKNRKFKTPQFSMNEEWVQEYIKQNGEEPTFF